MFPFGSLLVSDYEASSGGFLPTDIADLTSWFRADLGHATLSDNDPLPSIDDQSGAGLVPTLAALGTPPTYLAAGINARPDILWNAGSATCLAGTDPNAMLGSAGITLFVIFQSTNTASGRMFGMQYNAFHYLLGINLSGGFGDGIVSFMPADPSGEARSDVPLNDGAPHVAVGTWSSDDNTARLYIDGVVAASITGTSSTTPAPGGGDVNAAGAGSDGTSAYQVFTGQEPEFGSYSRALAGSELSDLVSYLMTNAGI